MNTLHVSRKHTPGKCLAATLASASLALLAFASPAVADCPRGDLDQRYCDEDGDMVADLPADESEWVDPDTLIFAYTPVEDPAIYSDIWQPFIDHLAEVTERNVRFFAVQSNSAQVEAMRSGRLHIAGFSTGPTPFAVNLAGSVLGGFTPTISLTADPGTPGNLTDDINLLDFPVPLWNRIDGGRYMMTYAGCVTKNPDTHVMNVGVYRGMQRLTLNGQETDCVEISYAEKDRLYVPVQQLALVSRYAAEEGARPVLHRLGSTAWQKQKSRAKQAIQAMADGLIRAYAARRALPGHAFAARAAVSRNEPYAVAMVDDAVLSDCLQPRKAKSPGGVLSGREREVVTLIADGKTCREAAQALGISGKTAETHRASAMRKLGIATSAALIRYAIRNKLVQA